MVQGFPVENELERLRSELRTAFSDAGLRVNFDSRYKLVTAHSSLIRFRVPVSEGLRLFALCEQYRNHMFGSIVLTDFELVFNNWYQNFGVTESLAKSGLALETRVSQSAQSDSKRLSYLNAAL